MKFIKNGIGSLKIIIGINMSLLPIILITGSRKLYNFYIKNKKRICLIYKQQHQSTKRAGEEKLIKND